MATTILLVRHAVHDLVDRVLAGRALDVGLSAQGREQARRLARRLAGAPATRLQSSDRLRARQTAQPIADALDLPVEIVPAIDEVDFGRWCGCAFDVLQGDPEWRLWNSARGSARTPAGETMRGIQGRILSHVMALACSRPGEFMILVTHAEVIRAAIMYCRGIALDDFASVPVGPASVTKLCVDHRGIGLPDEDERASAVVTA